MNTSISQAFLIAVAANIAEAVNRRSAPRSLIYLLLEVVAREWP